MALSGIWCGLPSALSAMLRRALRVPAAPGRKTTVTVQTCAAPSAAAVHELAAIEKSAALTPLTHRRERQRACAAVRQRDRVVDAGTGGNGPEPDGILHGAA